MHIVAAFVALLGLAVAMPGAPGYDHHGKKKCHTTHTCKNVAYTTTRYHPHTSTKTYAATSYTPKPYTTVVTKTVTKETWVPYTYYTTKTIDYTTTVEYESSTVTTICTTKTIPYSTCETISTSSLSKCPVETSSASYYVKTYETPVTTHTKVPCPYVETKTYITKTASVCTEYNKKCWDEKVCKPTKPAAPHYGYGH